MTACTPQHQPPSRAIAIPRASYLPWPATPSLIVAASFQKTPALCMAHVHPPVRILGADHIPQHGPCVITPNHYYRPGFAAQWSALAISASVPTSVHWLMTRELTFPGKWFAPFGMLISRLLLDRIARALQLYHHAAHAASPR